MAGVKYRGTIKDLLGTEYRVDIYDKDTTPTSPETITLLGDGFSLNYNGDIRNKVNPIIASELTLYLAITSSTDENLLTLLASNVEGRFTLAVYRKVSIFYQLYWSGTILTDRVTFMDEAYPTRAELTASDDIGLLASIPYDDDGTDYANTDYDSPVTHIYNCLRKLRQVEDFYSSSNTFLIYGNDFFSVDEPVGADTLGTSRIKYLTWNNPDEEGNLQKFSSYEVIRNICTAFNLRLVQANGAFYLLPLGAYLYSQSQIDTEIILYDGTSGTGSQITSTSLVYTIGVSGEKMRGFKREYYQPYKRIERRQVYYGNLALAGSNLYDLVSGGTIADTDFSYESGSQLRVRGSVQVAYQDAGSPTGSSRIGRSLIALTIKVGNYYLIRNVTYSGTESLVLYGDTGTSSYTPGVSGAVSWSTTAGAYEILSPIFDRQGFYDDPVHGFNIELDILTLGLPANLVGVDFTAAIYDVSSSGTETLVTDNTEYLYAVIESLRVDFAEQGVSNGDELTFSATGQARNRDTLTQDAVFIGDVVSQNSRGVVEVYNGSSYQTSTGWKSLNTTTALNLNRLGVEEIGALYATTTKGLAGNLYKGELFPYKIIKEGSDYYLVSSMKYDAGSASYLVEAYLLYRDASGITSVQGDRQDVNDPVIGTGGTSGGGLNPVAPSGADGVTSVNGVTPDGTGDVTIDAGDIEYTSGTSVSKAILDAETDVTSLQSSVIVGTSDTDFVSGTTGFNANKTNGSVSMKIGGTEKARMSASLFTMGVDTDAPQLEATDYTKGIVLRDSTAQRWRITINTSGQLVITSI